MPRRLVSPLLGLFVAGTLGISASPAAASPANLGAFRVTPNTGVVGTAPAIEQVTPCPPIQPGYHGDVIFSVLSPSGVFTGVQPDVDVDILGNWMYGGVAGKREVPLSTMTNPYNAGSVTAFTPGNYTIHGDCRQFLNNSPATPPVLTGSYTPQPLTITGPAYTLRSPSTTVTQSSSITVTPTQACAPYGPNVHVYGMGGGVGSTTVPLNTDGTWPAVTLPIAPDAPPGVHYVYATCGNYAVDHAYQYGLDPVSGPSLAYAALTFTITTSTGTPIPIARGCGDAAIIAARGSGENDHGVGYPGDRATPIGQALHDRYHLLLYTVGTTPSSANDGYETGVTFPAVSVDPTQSDAAAYFASVDYGVHNLLFDIESVRADCGPSFPILLVGYSAGADVVQSVLEQLDQRAATGDTAWKSIRGAALMASPKFSPDDPTARGTFLADYPLSGLRTGGKASIPSRFAPVARTYCLQHDPVCVSSVENLTQHRDVHTSQYNGDSPSGAAIDMDAEGLFLSGLGKAPRTRDSGTLQAYRTYVGNHLRLSAASIYSSGSPTTSFRWDFNGRGGWDATTTLPWIDHDFGVNLAPLGLGQGQDRVTARVQITHANGNTTTQRLCIRRATAGAVTC